MNKQDLYKYLKELMSRALRYEMEIKKIPYQKFYPQNHMVFELLRKRNETLNKAIEVLNEECGYSLVPRRECQRNAKDIYFAISEEMRKIGGKEHGLY